MSGTPVTSFWRLAGMTYLQYVSRASSSVRGALKESYQNKSQLQEIFTYKAAKWDAGNASPKVEVTSLKSAGNL